ncbi:nitrate- and nitrite sensing domain-containing protein [Streptomyces sp. RTd22]|uniref:sensor histidine kinase n=1 Tax=Streptomyces sp. RTd22 TaxID=1841249 RepID=UPI0007C4DF73|nr:nitrate- and nitrite sensing domain-containing protein [Streptomyces sp. RTd22]
MRKKRLRGTKREHISEPRDQHEQGAAEETPPAAGSVPQAPAPQPPRGRTARVRNRLTASVALVSVAVLAAGAPAVLGALDDATEAQKLVDLAETNRGTVSLAHSLADERDAMTAFVAAGRTTSAGGGVSEDQRARVDRQVEEVRGQVPAALGALLDTLPEIRQQALTGKGSSLDVFDAYTEAVQALNRVADTLARKLPADADTGPAPALAPLGRAVEQASATRGLLLAALADRGGRSPLTAAAQRTEVREQSALADFQQLAPASARDAYGRTVNGTEVTTAERYLARLTDQPRLSGQDLFVNKSRLETALTARIDRMRGAESALASTEITRLGQLRDDDVTALEVSIALAGACLLLALGTSIHSARSMTRPLAALRLGARRVAADPAAEEPIAFKGRDDEFADAVRAVNQLHQAALRHHERLTTLDGDRTRLVGERQRLADEADALRAERDAVATRLEGLRARVHSSFVNLALRSLGLIERQLAIIESMEEQEQDPDRLETLFQLDHLATGMRRYGENLLIVAGSEHQANHPGPVPLLDVLRASISEVERYDRVHLQSLPPHAQVAGFAADSISHLIAELLENATAFSPPDVAVQVSGWLLESGEVMLSVQDEGIGMTPERLAELNERLADKVPEYCQGPQPDDPLGLGLYVVTRLAARHGVRVSLREQQPGGIAAVVVLPTRILPAGPPGAGLPPAAATGALGGTGLTAFPGAAAEANGNALPSLDRPGSPPSAGAPAGADEPGDAGADVPDDAATVPLGGTGVPGQRRPEPTPEESSAAQDAGPEPVSWAAPGEAWAGAADEDPYRMEPTPPRGHPAPGTGEELPVLPKRTPKTQTPGATEPAVPAAERTMELTVPGGEQAFDSRAVRPAGADAWGPAEPADPAEPAAPADPYAIGPDQHSHAPEPAGELRRTDKGLPKRTPRNVARRDPDPQERTGSVNAEELRRRLGGFQRGSRDGRRDAEAEIAARGTAGEQGTAQTGAQDGGGTVEEARG